MGRRSSWLVSRHRRVAQSQLFKECLTIHHPLKLYSSDDTVSRMAAHRGKERGRERRRACLKARWLRLTIE